MALLCFTLSSENVARTRDLLICLSKFSETVEMEATGQALILSAMNIAKTSFAAFVLDAREYFESYDFSPDLSDAFRCSVLNKALFSIFKVRVADAKELDTSVERCEVSVFEGPDRAGCRIMARLMCRHGVKKTFKLTYEPTTIQYPTFDDAAAVNTWTTSAQVLKAFSEHFGARTEHLDFYQDAGRMLLTSYTEKISRGSEILKQPLQTTIAIDRLDFDNINVDEHLHVGISVRDFRAVVSHAETLKTEVTARYSQPKQPMRLGYGESGLRCEFTLVTISDYLGTSIKTAAAAPADRASAPTSAHASFGSAHGAQPRADSVPAAAPRQMAAPPLPDSLRSSRNAPNAPPPRPSPPPPQASINQESLFLADDDDEDDARWGEKAFDDDNDAVRWDTGDILSGAAIGRGRNHRAPATVQQPMEELQDVPPTQRLSQIRGLFDD